jgi:hypothetical protein
MNRSGNARFEVVDGGREALERELLRALVYDLPTFDSIARRLTPASNDRLQIVKTDPVGSRSPDQASAACGADLSECRPS